MVVHIRYASGLWVGPYDRFIVVFFVTRTPREITCSISYQSLEKRLLHGTVPFLRAFVEATPTCSLYV